jgi:Mrr N-terminal domain
MTINPQNHEILIGIDAEVLDALTKDAKPFVDDPNAVLRRKLGLDASAASLNGSEHARAKSSRRSRPGRERSERKRKALLPKRAPKGSLTPEPAFEAPILSALDQGDGELPVRDVLTAVGSQMKDVLNEEDLFTDEKGVARWEKRVPFVRLRLVERGLLDNDAPRGMWRITDAGRDHLETRRQETTT